MSKSKVEEQQLDVNFESHPPIQEDIDGITSLLRQTFLTFIDSHAVAQHLIDLNHVTQVIALEPEEEENASEDDDPDNNIYGVTSVINLQIVADSKQDKSLQCRIKLLEFLQKKCEKITELKEDTNFKLGFIINERYINLPPQLSVPTLKDLTGHLDEQKFTHLILLSKIFIKSRSSDTDLPSKKQKKVGNSSPDPLIFANPEEEIICEGSEHHVDFDVSDSCDENASWTLSSDIRYIPHRRVLIVDSKKWPDIMKSLEKELTQR